MRCVNCGADLLCVLFNVNDIAVCPECGEISVMVAVAPMKLRLASPSDCDEIGACENGRRILMYSALLKAQRKGLFATPGNA